MFAVRRLSFFRSCITALLLSAASGLGTGIHAEEAGHETPYRIALVPDGPTESWSERRCGTIAFWWPGALQERIRDIRMTDAAETPLPFRVLQCGPGDLLRLAFAYAEEKRVMLHLPALSTQQKELSQEPLGRIPPDSPWTPTGGLLLSTWPLPPEANADSWPAMQKLLAAVRTTRPYGRMFVDRVYHGHHPFHPPDAAFVSAYEGWLGCPGDGRYVFATSSDDASFLLIDGKLVVDWPGSHGARWDAKHNAAIDLPRGVHRFEYYHVNFEGSSITCAAWQPPDADRITPIPPASFAPVTPFRIALEDKRPLPPLLLAQETGATWVDGELPFRYRFTLLSNRNWVSALTWEFGDGGVAALSDGPESLSSEHVYLTPGLRTIRIAGKDALSGAREVMFRVWTHADPARSAQTELDDPAPFARAVADFPFARLSTPDAQAALHILAASAEYDAATLRAGQTLLARDSLSSRLRFDTAVLIGQRMRTQNPDEAVGLYREAIRHFATGERRLRAELLRQIGDTYLYFIGDLDAALNEYDKVVGRYADALDDNIVRVTKIKIGDIFRQRGDGAAARRVYSEAAELKLHQRSLAQDIVRKGALYKTIDDFLKRHETENARNWLEILEWEYPLEKLDGYSSIVRARVALAENNRHEARKQLRWFLAAAPDSAYAAEAMFALLEFELHEKNFEEAKRLAERLRADYPDSPFTVRARDRLAASPETP